MELERLINRHKDAVYRQMVRVCGNYDDAEDALAEAFLAALKAADQLRDPSSFQGWLAKIGTRVCVRKRIRERLMKTVSLGDLTSKGIDVADHRMSPDEEAEAKVLRTCVAGAIDALPEVYREVYLRREILGERAEDVAAALNLSVPAVKSRLHRARLLTRESLDSGLGCAGLADAIS
jgi:RNA polymerase sigma-70 factor (ECF subfamily)